jgi:hypothetical protein
VKAEAARDVPSHGYETALDVLKDSFERLREAAASLEGVRILKYTRDEVSNTMSELADAIGVLEHEAARGRRSVPAPAKRKPVLMDPAAPPPEKKKRGRPRKVRESAADKDLFAEFDAPDEGDEGDEREEPAPPEPEQRPHAAFVEDAHAEANGASVEA